MTYAIKIIMYNNDKNIRILVILIDHKFSNYYFKISNERILFAKLTPHINLYIHDFKCDQLLIL